MKKLSDNKKSVLWVFIVSTLFLVIFLSYLSWTLTNNFNEQQVKTNILDESNRINASMQTKLRRYQDLVNFTEAYFQNSENIDRLEFRGYISDIELEKNFKGVSSIVFAHKVTTEDITNFEEQVINDTRVSEGGYPNFKIRPILDEYNVYYPVTFIEPGDETRINALGFDLASEEKRNRAIQNTINTGEIAATGKITFVNGIDGFLMIKQVSNSLESQSGLVAVSFRLNDLFEAFKEVGVFGNGEVSYRVYESEIKDRDNLLFESDNLDNMQELIQSETTISLANKNWVVEIYFPNNYGLGSQDELMPVISTFSTFIIGMIVFAVLVLLFVRYLTAGEKLNLISEILTVSENKFKTIFNGLDQFIGVLDLDGKFTEVNDTYLKFAQISKNNIVGYPMWEVESLNHSENNIATINKAIERGVKGQRFRSELQLIDSKGNEFRVAFSLSPIFDEDGEVILLVTEGKDITDSSKMRSELTERNEELEKLTDKLINRELKMAELKKKLKGK